MSEKPGDLIRKPWAFAIAVAVSGSLLCGGYSNYFDNTFHFDDSYVVESNIYIRSLSNVPRFFSNAETSSSLPSNAVYRPHVTLSLAIDYWLGGGPDPWQFHVTQFVLLVILGVMLFFFYLGILNNSQDRNHSNAYTALFLTALFCLHTVNTETLNIISARSELISSIGLIGAFLLYMYVPASRALHLYLIPVAFGALAKLPAVIFAPLLLVYLVLFEKRLSFPESLSLTFWPDVRTVLLRTAPAFLFGALLFFFVEAMNHPEQLHATISRIDYLVTQPFVWLHYVRLFFLPVGLTADTDWTVLLHWYDSRFFAGLMLIALLICLAWAASKRSGLRAVAFGLVWFMLALLPASSIFPLSEVANEHRPFLPYIGLSLSAGSAAAYWLRKLAARGTRWSVLIPAISGIAAFMVLSAHAWGGHRRNEIWHTEETLWLDVTRKSPSNGRGLMNYGLTQMAKGELKRAEEYFERAKVLNPSYSVLEVNLGIVRQALGDPASAERSFQRALRLSPRSATGHFFFARWLTQRERSPEAIFHLETAIAISPGDPGARHLLMHLYAAKGEELELQRLARATLALAPGDPVASGYTTGESHQRLADGSAQSHFRRGNRLLGQKRYPEAAVAFQKAVELESDFADAYNNLGWTRGKLGFYREAAPPLRQALAIRPDYDLARNNLAWVEQELKANEGP